MDITPGNSQRKNGMIFKLLIKLINSGWFLIWSEIRILQFCDTSSTRGKQTLGQRRTRLHWWRIRILWKFPASWFVCGISSFPRIGWLRLHWWWTRRIPPYSRMHRCVCWWGHQSRILKRVKLDLILLISSCLQTLHY